MTVTASFQPEHVAAVPGGTSTLSLHLQNNGLDEAIVRLRRTGDLERRMGLATESVHLDPGEHFEVTVVVEPLDGLPAGLHQCSVEVTAEETDAVDEVTGARKPGTKKATVDADALTASAAIDVAVITAWEARLVPVRSIGATRGRHRIAIDNLGNAPIALDLAASSEANVGAEVAVPRIEIDGGGSARVALRVVPRHRFWTGAHVDHAFTATVVGVGEEVTLEGIYEQSPRLRPWVIPALAGMLGAMLIGLLAWFVVFKPAVEDIARDEAEELDVEQQEALDARVAAIQEAAEEAARLPLGDPTDLRMEVTATAATTSSEAFDFDRAGNGRVLSITDVIFQNPTGAVGRLELLRNGEVLLDQEMANFRDLDFHLVAPFRVESESEIALRLTCESPGPGTSECEAAATIIGFVDDA